MDKFNRYRESGLVKGKNLHVVTLILLNQASSLDISVERIHQNQWDVNFGFAAQVFNLANNQIKESHSISHLDSAIMGPLEMRACSYLLGPTHPIVVPRPPLSFSTASFPNKSELLGGDWLMSAYEMS